MAVILQDAEQRMPPNTDPLTNPTQMLLKWAYVDDITLKFRLSFLCTALVAMRDSLARYGCELQPLKCNICVPALRDRRQAEWPAALCDAMAMGFTRPPREGLFQPHLARHLGVVAAYPNVLVR